MADLSYLHDTHDDPSDTWLECDLCDDALGEPSDDDDALWLDTSREYVCDIWAPRRDEPDYSDPETRAALVTANHFAV